MKYSGIYLTGNSPVQCRATSTTPASYYHYEPCKSP